MSAEEFDASLVHTDPVGDEVLAQQTRMAEQLMLRPNALANAKLAYADAAQVYARPRWGVLAQRGARTQRPPDRTARKPWG
mgnify:CR=1 FL=1